jgi:uncharacterized protein YbcV (DUF1398 family)
MKTQEIHDVFAESQAGNLIFPEVVRRMIAAGVESYFCDFANAQETVYGANGETHIAPMSLNPEPVSAAFSATGIVAAIRGAQADSIRYPEFVRQSTAAGVIAYWAFLTGKKVIYIGRQGEMHVEEFPGQKK